MSKYVEIGYPIYDGMGVYPGLPIPTVKIREDLTKGDPWNGSVMDRNSLRRSLALHGR